MATEKAIKKDLSDRYSGLTSYMNDLWDKIDSVMIKVNDYEDEFPEFRNSLEEVYQALGDVETAIQFGILDEIGNGYSASTKKSRMAKLDKKLNKLGGFTKEDDDKVEVEVEDGKVEIETEGEESEEEEEKDEEFLEEDEEEIEEACKGCDSQKAVKGMRANKKRMKMKKGEDMPADADDFKEDNQAGTGNAGSTLPEDADDTQDDVDPGEGNAEGELPEDADEQQDIKESARKMRLARMQRAKNKSARKSVPPVRKFSVTAGGSPDQTSYNQRYQQAPMVREAIDRGSSVEKFDEVGMLQDRLDTLYKSKRSPIGNSVPKRLR